jgi:hypothetical protein
MAKKSTRRVARKLSDPAVTRSADRQTKQRTSTVQDHLNNAIRPLDAEPLEPVSLGASVARHLALVRLAVRGIADAVRELEARAARSTAQAFDRRGEGSR